MRITSGDYTEVRGNCEVARSGGVRFVFVKVRGHEMWEIGSKFPVLYNYAHEL
jgi:hypothetical protein